MKKLLPLLLLALVCANLVQAQALKPRLKFEKYLWAEGVDPHARSLNRLMVKFFDEDMVRLRNGQLTSTNGANTLLATKDFLARHPEIAIKVIITSMTEEDYAAMNRRNELRSGKDLVDLFSFYEFRLESPAADPKGLLAEILEAPEVETAYYEPIPYPMTCTDLGTVTPDYEASQTYHNAAPLGVDLPYANTTFGLEVTDGLTSTSTGIAEVMSGSGGFHLGHEDFTTVVNATPEVTFPTSAGHYHGTSVGGIVGACDENGVGCVGFTADHSMRVYDIGALATVADVYTRINSQLSAGEYCTNSWGYFSSPMVPGQTCPCNPGQNGMVPAEYNAAVKAAIDAGVAGGIFYILSAGNGCTDLDHATYGNTFRWSTDTGSMYVGGVESTTAHDAICYTCYGERVTLNAWAQNVVTTGKGTLRTGTGVNEYYADDFGGTSAAGPIVAGCAGVLNNIYRDINSGANISPTTLRSWLTWGGTQPASEPGNIGVQPNLFGITSPDLNPDLRSGWSSYYVIPRNSGDATGSDAILPATLVSDPDTTFLTSAMENTSHFGSASPARWRLYRDDDFLVSIFVSSGTLGPQGRTWLANWDTFIRGGRHTLRNTSDAQGEVAEYYESNNTEAEQFVWNPRPLTSETPLVFSAPPTRLVTAQPGVYYNCDGYSFSSGFSGNWDLFGVIAENTSADYDVRIYSEAVSATNGLDDYESWSAFGGSSIDVVGRNQHNVAGTAYASVINWDNSNYDYAVEGETSTYMGVPGFGRNSAGSNSLSANEIVESIEFYVNQLVPYEIEASMTSGNANIVISVFGPDDAYFKMGDRNAFVNNGGAGESEYLCFTPAQVGYHLALIHKNNASDYGQTATFTTYIGKALGDLTHNLNAGWSHEIVVRQTTGATPAVLPATLTGNVATNYLNAAYINAGCDATPAGMNDRFYLDGPSVHTTGSWAAHSAGETTQWLNQGPITVFGGRHNIGDSIDVFNEYGEWNEFNNRTDVQFVWTPFNMTNQSATLQPSPAPNFRNTQSAVSFSAWNQDGYRFRDNGRWSGLAVCPVDAGDDYVMALYDTSTGSQDGFDVRLVPSFFAGPGGISFVVENGSQNAASTFDVGVTNNYSWPTTPSLGGYRLWQCNSVQVLANDATNGIFTLGLNQLMHVFDLQLTAGDTTRFILDNLLGGVDLGLAIFDPTDAYGSRSHNGTVINAAGDGADETITFVPTATGRHGVVVFKNNNTDLASCQYRLIIGDRAPAAPQHLVLQVLNSAVDPIQMRAHWDSVLVDVNGAALNVDHYQLYYTLNPNLAFPTGWVPYITTTLATVDFGVAGIVNTFNMVVVAVDADGFVLSHSGLPGGTDLRGVRLSDTVSQNSSDSPRVIGEELQRFTPEK